LFSQDLLTTKDGRVLEVKIQKIDEDIIQYYRYTDDSKILFTEEKAAFTKIEFVDFVPSNENIGSTIHQTEKDKGNFIINGKEGYSFDELEGFLRENNNIAYTHFNKYKKYKNSARALGISTLVIFGLSGIGLTSIANDGDSPPAALIFSVIGLGLVVPIIGTASLIVYARSKTYKKRVLDIYGLTSHYLNDSKNSEIPQLKIGLVSIGVGLQIIF